MRDFRNQRVWQKAHVLTLAVYRDILPHFPKHELFHLASQTKRASYSIPMNIAEGCGKRTEKDFASFLDIALGSAHELEYCCFLAYELNYLNLIIYNTINAQINEVKAMLIVFLKTIRT